MVGYLFIFFRNYVREVGRKWVDLGDGGKDFRFKILDLRFGVRGRKTERMRDEGIVQGKNRLLNWKSRRVFAPGETRWKKIRNKRFPKP
jgi:hypothetical protein